jgi:hypothetical protein
VSKFWTCNQNNSGGSFDFQPNDGITHFVVIEANDETHAMQRALDIGLYFNGCNDGTDCSCCGDRWYEPYGEGEAEPMIYDTPVAAATAWKAWMPEGKEICVHYLDGRKEWHGITKEKR